MNALRKSYELVTDVLNREFVAKNVDPFKTLAPNSRSNQELQEVTTDYKIQLRTSRTDYVSATNPKIYQFVAIRGSSGRSVIPQMHKHFLLNAFSTGTRLLRSLRL